VTPIDLMGSSGGGRAGKTRPFHLAEETVDSGTYC